MITLWVVAVVAMFVESRGCACTLGVAGVEVPNGSGGNGYTRRWRGAKPRSRWREVLPMLSFF